MLNFPGPKTAPVRLIFRKMAWLLDTNVISELRKKSRCDANVATWQAGVSIESCFISVITLMEIVNGIESTQRKNAKFASVLSDWYQNQVVPGFINRTLAVTPGIAEKTGQIMAIRTRSTADCLLAGTALIHGLTLVTRNTSDFSDTGVLLHNPWEN